MVGAREGGGVSGGVLPSPCAPGTCPGPDPQAMAANGPLPGPVRGTPRSELFAMASLGSRCRCTIGGGGCNVAHCSDPDACTMAQCDPNTGSCRTSSYCSEKCCGQYGWCCDNDVDCCEHHSGGCCPPARPACCGAELAQMVRSGAIRTPKFANQHLLTDYSNGI